MVTRTLGLVVAVTVAMPARAEPLVFERLAPYSPWKIDYAEDSCRLSRGFGSKDKPFSVQFERSGTPDGFQLKMAGDQLKSWRPPKKLAVRYFKGGQNHVMDKYLVGLTAGGTPLIWFWSSLDPSQPASDFSLKVTPEMEAAVTEINFSYQHQQISLSTGSLGPAFAELRKCSDQLFSIWGIEPEKLRHALRRATPNNSPASWATSADYSAFAGSSGRRADVYFRLIVGPNGRPSRCMVTSSYPDNAFDAITCKSLVQRALFKPALDAAGNPISDTYSNTVRWGPAD